MNAALSPESMLRRAGLKVTQVRLHVLSLLMESPVPLAHSEVIERLPGRHWDRVTVYRTLHTFMEKGLTLRLEGGDRVWRFAARYGSHPEGQEHAHFLCEECGEMECIEEVKLVPPDPLPRGFQVRRSEMVLHGLCPNCSSAP